MTLATCKPYQCCTVMCVLQLYHSPLIGSMAVNIPVKFDLSCKDVTESGILEILQHVKPEWNRNVKIGVS